MKAIFNYNLQQFSDYSLFILREVAFYMKTNLFYMPFAVSMCNSADGLCSYGDKFLFSDI